MSNLKQTSIALILFSGLAVANEPASSTQPNATVGSTNAQKSGAVQHGPIVGSMLEDGRDVPTRFRGRETKEQQQKRSQQQEQKESDDE